mmetsp:Transcript_4786/g.8228  ORF Transcript_4786/g.8228 Transcript_4786/m.8228 type:complete len:425 (+) Transcript_4786:29-1303(+)
MACTLGATAKEVARAHLYKESPFVVDKDAVFPSRHGGMSLDVIRKGDAVKAKALYPKDYDRSLITSDIPLAQPVLGHERKTAETRLAWASMQKPPPEEVPGSRSNPGWNPFGEGRERPLDFSLTTSDIEFAQPGKQKLFHQPRPPICESSRIGAHHSRAASATTSLLQASGPVPLSARLTRQTEEPPHLARLKPTELTPRATADTPSGATHAGAASTVRNNLDTSDIEGARPGRLIPKRNKYVDSMRNEVEFQSTARRLAARRAEQPGYRDPEEIAAGQEARRAPMTPRREGPQRSGRTTNPLQPQYKVPLIDGGAYMDCQWDEERGQIARAASTLAEVGEIDGGKPRALRSRRDILCSLQTDDIEGTQPELKIGVIPHSIWSDRTRPELAHKLDSRDIAGAQADTQMRGPPIYSRRRRAVLDG